MGIWMTDERIDGWGEWTSKWMDEWGMGQNGMREMGERMDGRTYG